MIKTYQTEELGYSPIYVCNPSKIFFPANKLLVRDKEIFSIYIERIENLEHIKQIVLAPEYPSREDFIIADFADMFLKSKNNTNL